MKKWGWYFLVCVLAAGCVLPQSLARPGASESAAPTVLAPQWNLVPDPHLAAQIYLDAWLQEDYSAMYAWLAVLSQDALSQTEFEQTHRSIAGTLSLESMRFEILSALAKGRTAQVGLHLSYKTRLVGEISRETVMNLILEGDQWRVLWDYSLVLPELAGGNTLWMDYRMPSRGNIYDRNGHALVAQADAVSLGLVVGETDPAQEPALLQAIWQLTGVTPEITQAKISAYQQGWYLPLGETAAERVEALYGSLANFTGLVMEPFRARYYFGGGIAPHIIGYVSVIAEEEVETYLRLGYQRDERVGRMGLEKWAEPALAGQHGGILYVVSPEGSILTKLAESTSQPSQAVYTTLDRDLQVGAQAALEGFSGAAVVLERDSGRILALASSPGFDPNIFEPTNYNSSYSLEELLNHPDTPLLNRASQGLYPLGSIFKVITLAAALESGQYTVDSTYQCGHKFTELPGTTRYDWTYSFGAPPSGLLTLPEGLMRSCNPWFWHIGLDFFNQGLDKLVSNMGRGFGLGQPTGVKEFVEEAGNLADPQNQVDAVNFSIGQGETLVTPLQVARLIAAVGNGGTLYRPQLIEKIEPPGGAPSFTFTPDPTSQLPITPQTLATLQQALDSVVTNPRGTAYWRFINFQIALAGKTGTAEAPPNDPHAWFAGYTTASQPDKPDIAIAVVLEHAGEGSEVAAPVFKRLVEIYFFGRAVSPLPWENQVETPPLPGGGY